MDPEMIRDVVLNKLKQTSKNFPTGYNIKKDIQSALYWNSLLVEWDKICNLQFLLHENEEWWTSLAIKPLNRLPFIDKLAVRRQNISRRSKKTSRKLRGRALVHLITKVDPLISEGGLRPPYGGGRRAAHQRISSFFFLSQVSFLLFFREKRRGEESSVLSDDCAFWKPVTINDMKEIAH